MTYILDAEHIFTLFFIMLGPIKLLIPYAQATQNLGKTELFHISFKACVLATVIVVLGSFSGQYLLVKWLIPIPVLMLTAGIIMFMTSIGNVIPSHSASHDADVSKPALPKIMQVIFPMILTPYGVAILIVLLATANGDLNRIFLILGLLLVNMVLNFLTMIYVRPIMKTITPTGMQILGAVLGILLVALSLEIIRQSLTAMNIIQGPIS